MTVDFLKLVRQKKVCVVGNEKFPMPVLNYLYGDDVYHVKVPYLNAFYSHEKLTQEVVKAHENKRFDIILFAASFATYPMIVNLFEILNNKKHFTPDGYHLNVIGQDLLFKKILFILKNN